ncbi:radical SAM family heme chaperone HemW [Lichenihabitans sp. Uapishka_5]|uniref:radical SAM family heme chaperone HemW n=1 Tax=Lichenihabitans sp. Uapishka_5 TaxID=3037302 RepID=UPI0029E7E197|nr:radical SAM family heme chaperone HemW [Lichenihabitans sp. Uapishka_5]MDX7953800.1 radical SAM family heme chaperone HemW [Lichenihabitans sp. Uapishka_5]
MSLHLIGSNSGDPGFGVYVHWPFCLSKCPYCDFNSHVRQAPVDENRFLQAFRTELAHRARIAPRRIVSSVFFGGGTPSLMQPRTVGALLNAIAAHWPLAHDVEVTLEANPTSVEAERFRGYRDAGVNRVSLGVQAMNDTDLKALGRLHTADEAMQAVGIAQSIFERYSFDLIYARPFQSTDAWRAELNAAIDRAAEHLSLYQLTVEPDTMFEKLHRAGKLKVPDAEHARALWDVTQEVTAARGLPAYEISNHARPGAESRHNLIYWRYGEYAGVGPGAHGRMRTQSGQRRAHSTERHPEMWLTVVEGEGHGLISDDPLDRDQQGDEFLLMGLRLREGIDPRRFTELSGKRLNDATIDELAEQGLVVRTRDGRLRVTQEGFPVLDMVVAELAA